MQTCSHVMMVRPARFLSNPQTSASNGFQPRQTQLEPAWSDPAQSQSAALHEFDRYAAALRAAGVAVLVVEDSLEPHTPDALFPNNWVSFHANGDVLLYPMEAPNRRFERDGAALAQVGQRFAVARTVDLSAREDSAQFLEGTGSLVLDRERRVAYVCHSSRSHPQAMLDFTAHTGYRAHWFHATDGAGLPIYHTNVMMSVGSRLAVVCLAAVRDGAERAALRAALEHSGKRIVEISLAQMGEFAGNMLELKTLHGGAVWAMSRRAWQALLPAQRAALAADGEPVIAALDTIERLGGGGARCMLAEIFLPQRAA